MSSGAIKSTARRRAARKRAASKTEPGVVRWLRAGAVVAGMGAAMATGSAVAAADEGSDPTNQVAHVAHGRPAHDKTAGLKGVSPTSGPLDKIAAATERVTGGASERKRRHSSGPVTVLSAQSGVEKTQRVVPKVKGTKINSLKSGLDSKKCQTCAVDNTAATAASMDSRAGITTGPQNQATATVSGGTTSRAPFVSIQRALEARDVIRPAVRQQAKTVSAQAIRPQAARLTESMTAIPDKLRLTELGVLSNSSTVPVAPVRKVLESLWTGLRRAQYSFANRYPTTSLVQDPQNLDNGKVTGAINGRDADGDRLTYTVVDEPDHGTVEVNADGTYAYRPDNAFAHAGGSDSFTVVVDDKAGNPWHVHGLADLIGLSKPTEVTVHVTVAKLVNQPPTAPAAVDGPLPGTDGKVTGSLAAADSNGDPLTYSAGTLEPTKGRVVVNADGSYTYTPNAADSHAAAGKPPTPDAFTIVAIDGYGGTVVTTVNVIVHPTNTAPTAAPTATVVNGSKILLSASTDASGFTTAYYATPGVVAISANVGDGEADALTVTAVNADATLGAVKQDPTLPGTFTYTPSLAALKKVAVGEVVTDTVTIEVDDGHGGIVSKDVVIEISKNVSANLEITGTGQFIDVGPNPTVVDTSGLTDTGPELEIVGLDGFVKRVGGNLIFTDANGRTYDLGAYDDVQSVQVVTSPSKDKAYLYANSALMAIVDLGPA